MTMLNRHQLGNLASFNGISMDYFNRLISKINSLSCWCKSSCLCDKSRDFLLYSISK